VEEEMELQMAPARGTATQEAVRVAAGRCAPAKEVLRRLEAVVAMAAMVLC
jgi:hypothetical protein